MWRVKIARLGSNNVKLTNFCLSSYNPSFKESCALYKAASRSLSTRVITKPNISSSNSAHDSLQNSELQHNILDIHKEYISQKISDFLGVPLVEVSTAILRPTVLDKGDLLLPLAKLGFKSKINEHKSIEEIYNLFSDEEFFESVEVKGPFLQFYFNHINMINTIIPKILKEGSNYGKDDLVTNKTVLVEFSSPNIAKPFHAGHLRSTIIGGFLSNLYENFGWNVVRMNYLGDWGKQFGILAAGFEEFGDEKELANDPINHLFDVYVKANKEIDNDKNSLNKEASMKARAQKFFKQLESGDASALKIWKTFRDLSIKEYSDTYSKLRIKFDCYSGESYVPKQVIKEILLQMKAKGICHESRGVQVVDLTSKKNSLGHVVVEKSDSTSLYITRDIGGAIARKSKYKFDKMIYVISSQQDLYMKQFFEILKRLGYKWVNNLEHINFGMVNGMSTRKGNVVFLNTIIKEATKKMKEVLVGKGGDFGNIENIDDIAEQIGISAIMIQDMQAKRVNNYTFDWKRILTFEGDTGPYLQYTHSRLCQIAERFPEVTPEELVNADFSLVVQSQAILLARLMCQYPDILRHALKTREPSTVVTYLFKLTHQISSCYGTIWVAGQPKPQATANLALYMAARQVLANGLQILGLTPIEKM